MSCCFISCLTCLRLSTSFLISLGRIPISRSESGISGISSDSSSCYHGNKSWNFFLWKQKVHLGLRHTSVPGYQESECYPINVLLKNHFVVNICTTHLILLSCVVSLSLHGGEADVELLDDRRIQAVEVKQQHELVVETCGEMEGGYRNMNTCERR